MCVAEEVGSIFVDTEETAAGTGLVLPIGSCVGTAVVKVPVPVIGVKSAG